MAKTIKDVECPIFNFPAHPVPKIIANPDGTRTQQKVNKMDIYIWKKDYELICSQKADFIKKGKRVLPIVLDQCSPSLKSQLLQLIHGFYCKLN